MERRVFAERVHEGSGLDVAVGARLGDRSALDSAAILVAEVENPALRGRIQSLRAAVAA